MNSDRSILALAFVALATSACFAPQPATPPTFPAGGLLARSTRPPIWIPSAPGTTYESMTPVLKALEGNYVASSRFGNPVTVNTSFEGSADDQLQATLALFATDQDAVAILHPGCFVDSSSGTPVTKMFFEGWWRYLQTPDPTPKTTGLVRLFVEPQAAADALCRGEAVTPGTVTLTGGTGFGEGAPASPITLTYQSPRKSRLVNGRPAFMTGAHHGGCQTSQNCGVSENTPETNIIASQLGAGYIELDVRLTADSPPVAVNFHLGLSPGAVTGTYCAGGIDNWTYDQLVANCRLLNGEVIPRLQDTLEYALTRTNLVIWLDMKVSNAVVPSGVIVRALNQKLVQCQPGQAAPAGKRCLFPGSKPVTSRVVIGLPSTDDITAYQNAKAAGQLDPNQQCLIEEDYAMIPTVPCIAFGPRYTRGPMRDTVASLQSQGIFVGYWTLNDAPTMDVFLQQGLPNGFLTNNLGTMASRWEAVGILPSYPYGQAP
jgi:glycerophosphoryl diester phosphodiesterase